jgi:thioredoxin reductase
MSNSDSSKRYHAVVVGGGPAGLQAALTLGRMHRPTVMFDSGEYRNATVQHAHNLIGHDGRAPAGLRGIARDELRAYADVELRDIGVRSIDVDAGGFVVTTADGARVSTRTIVLATGMRDALPPIPGLAEEWGGRVAQCPFCHGHEYSGLPIAVLGSGAHAAMIAGMLDPIVSEITILDPAVLERVTPRPDGLDLLITDGSIVAASGIFVAATSTQRAPFAEQLGCRLLESGCVEVDALGRTSVAGVYAAGDMAHVAALPGPMVSLAAAIASGQLAGAGSVRDALMETLAG